MKRLILAFAVPLILIALPFFLRPRDLPEKPDSAVRLVLVSAHSEAIKYEFEHAFRKHYQAKYGKDVVFDWRDVGGTSDIVRYANDRFSSEFRKYAQDRGIAWTEQTALDFKNPRIKPSDSPVRKMFLESDVGIGVDIFFGGGSYEHSKFANMGFAVDSGSLKRHPEYFAPERFPQNYAGEIIYDPQGRFFGVCLSSFGIVSNRDACKEIGLPLPVCWADLCNPKLRNWIVVGDPTKSGSITKCYEIIIQQAMAEFGPERGWKEGFARIRRMAANSRAVVDSAGKVVRDVSSGTAAAGICIDFYGLSEADFTNGLAGMQRLIYQTPHNGSAVTCDPVLMFRGAPNDAVAREFIDFLLSEAGQRLWIQKPGTPGGPRKYALFRSCVRKDLYERPDLKPAMSYPDYNPYRAMGSFVYRPEWTGRAFSLIRILIKCDVLDPLDELHAAWNAILEHGGEAANPEAVAELDRLPVEWKDVSDAIRQISGTPGKTAEVRRIWMENAWKRYRKAADLTKKR